MHAKKDFFADCLSKLKTGRVICQTNNTKVQYITSTILPVRKAEVTQQYCTPAHVARVAFLNKKTVENYYNPYMLITRQFSQLKTTF